MHLISIDKFYDWASYGWPVLFLSEQTSQQMMVNAQKLK